jgi:hypothetical protein
MGRIPVAAQTQQPQTQIESARHNLAAAEEHYSQKSVALDNANQQLDQKRGERPVYVLPNENGYDEPPWAQQRFIEDIRHSVDGVTVPRKLDSLRPAIVENLRGCYQADNIEEIQNLARSDYSDMIKAVFTEAFRDDYFTTAFPFNAEYMAQVLSEVEIILYHMCNEHQDCREGQHAGFYASKHLPQREREKPMAEVFSTVTHPDMKSSVLIHEIGHALGLGEPLAVLLQIELGRDAKAINNSSWRYYPGFDKVLLERAGAQKFWTAAFTSNEAYKELWAQYISEVSIEELVLARIFMDSDFQILWDSFEESPFPYQLGRPSNLPMDFQGIMDGDKEMLERMRELADEKKLEFIETIKDNNEPEEMEEMMKEFEDTFGREFSWDAFFELYSVLQQPVLNGIIYDEHNCDLDYCGNDCLMEIYTGTRPQNSISTELLVSALNCFNERIDEFYESKNPILQNQQRAYAEYNQAKAVVIQLRNEYEELLAQQNTATTTMPETTTEPVATTTTPYTTSTPDFTTTTPTTTTQPVSATTQPAATTGEPITTYQTTAQAVATTTAPEFTTSTPVSATTEKLTTSTFNYSTQGNEQGTAEENPKTGVAGSPITTAGFVGGFLFTAGAIALKEKTRNANKGTSK